MSRDSASGVANSIGGQTTVSVSVQARDVHTANVRPAALDPDGGPPPVP